MAEVSIAVEEFERRFGCYREVAREQPVLITSDAGETMVLLSVDEYRRLKMRDRQALYAWELTDEDAAAIALAEPPPEAMEFDEEAKAS